MSHKSSRRSFLRSCVGTLVAGAASGANALPLPAPAKSRVVIARDPGLRGSGSSPESARVLRLLDGALQAFYDRNSPLEAWRRLVRPGEVVGLKVNCMAGRGFSTQVVLVEAIAERLQQAGIREIVVFDRFDRDLEAGSFGSGGARRGAIRYIGNDTAGFDDELTIFGSVGSRISRTLTQTCHAVINLPVLKDHGMTGFTAAMKNMFGVIHNPNKCHPNRGDPYIADVNMLPPIRAKVRLTICDALTAQYEGGPGYNPQWSWPYNGLLVARDPVALDYTGWKIVDRQRVENGLKTLAEDGREPRYIATAADAQHRLGTNNPALIERREV